jgi:hypothetical protein
VKGQLTPPCRWTDAERTTTLVRGVQAYGLGSLAASRGLERSIPPVKGFVSGKRLIEAVTSVSGPTLRLQFLP